MSDGGEGSREKAADGLAALEALVRAQGPAILGLARRLVGDADEAQDLAQDALVRALRAYPSFRGDCTLRTWVLRIVVHESLRRLRRRGLWNELSRWLPTGGLRGRVPMPDVLDPERLASLGEEARALAAALARLPARQRVVLTLRHVEGMSLQEIATLLEVGPGTVKTHLVRGLRRVRAAWPGTKGLPVDGESDEVA